MLFNTHLLGPLKKVGEQVQTQPAEKETSVLQITHKLRKLDKQD